MRALANYGRRDVQRALAQGSLVLTLGPFAVQLKSTNRRAADFFCDLYRDCPVSLTPGELADFSLQLRAPNLIRRFIRRQITPDPGFHFPTVPLPPEMAPLALEMGMNLTVAMQCFRFGIFHAGVVADDAGAIVISAHSGGGKSTLTAAMMEEGFRLLSDEFAILGTTDPMLHPYPRPVSLKNRSIAIARDFAGADAMSPVLTGTPKGDIAYRRARQSDIAAMDRPMKARLLLFPRFTEGAAPEARKLERGDAVTRFIAGSPNYHILGEAAFTSLMAFADGLEAFELIYGNTEDSVRLTKELWKGRRA